MSGLTCVVQVMPLDRCRDQERLGLQAPYGGRGEAAHTEVVYILTLGTETSYRRQVSNLFVSYASPPLESIPPSVHVVLAPSVYDTTAVCGSGSRFFPMCMRLSLFPSLFLSALSLWISLTFRFSVRCLSLCLEISIYPFTHVFQFPINFDLSLPTGPGFLMSKQVHKTSWAARCVCLVLFQSRSLAPYLYHTIRFGARHGRTYSQRCVHKHPTSLFAFCSQFRILQGVGRALLRRCVWLSRQEESIGAVYLHVITTNPPAHRFYESEGFVQVCCINGENFDDLHVCMRWCVPTVYSHKVAATIFFLRALPAK